MWIDLSSALKLAPFPLSPPPSNKNNKNEQQQQQTNKKLGSSCSIEQLSTDKIE